MRRVWWFVAVLAPLGACNNPCQRLCARMADYAEECGFTVPADQMDACVERQSGGSLDEGEKGVCREMGDPEVLRAQWSCEELETYWGTAGTP